MHEKVPHRLVAITREEFDDSPWYGIVVQESALYIVIQHVSDRFDLDGYHVLRRADITTIEDTFDRKSLIETALRLKGLAPGTPAALELSSMRGLLESVQEQYGVLVLTREALEPDDVEIGTIRMTSEQTYVLRWLTPDAEWDNDDRPFRYEDITMVQFDGEYEKTLLMVSNCPDYEA
ncbi:MAG: hypothetical protein V4857_28055 [Pseudomonadota bacterium]